MWKKKLSSGNYEFRDDAKIFKIDFYYINFLDAKGKFESEHSEKLEIKKYAENRANFLSKNSWALDHIDYKVTEIGLYSSSLGHIKSYKVK